MAINGASLQMFAHGIITGGLFFLVGVIYERSHTRDLKNFGGLGKMTPYYYGIFMVTALASLGLPGLAGFWAEFFVFRGAFEIMPVFAAIGIIGVVLTAAYILWKIVQYVFLGEFDQEKWDEVTHGAKLIDMQTFEKVDDVAARPVHDRLWPVSHAHHQLFQQLCPEARFRVVVLCPCAEEVSFDFR